MHKRMHYAYNNFSILHFCSCAHFYLYTLISCDLSLHEIHNFNKFIKIVVNFNLFESFNHFYTKQSLHCSLMHMRL